MSLEAYYTLLQLNIKIRFLNKNCDGEVLDALTLHNRVEL